MVTEPADQLATLSDVVTPFAVRTAATLRLADHVHAGAATVAELAAVVDADPAALRALLAHLRDRGVVSLADDRVGLTAVGELLRSEVPGSWRTHLSLDGAPGLLQRTWTMLPDTVRTGGPTVAAIAGTDFWSALDADPALAASFAGWLGDWADRWTPAVAAALHLPDGAVVADVGGGDGRLLAALLTRHPAVRGLLVELPATAALAAPRLEPFGSRCSVVPGSFFDPLPAADVVVLGQVLHDWPDDDARRVLARAAAAADRLVVVERLADGAGHPAMDLLMAALFGARERRADELHALAASAGLTHDGTTDTGLGLHVLTYRTGESTR